MSIRIQLQDARSVYTNLDFIRGKAILSLTRAEDVTAVNVKLEGESKSRLEGEPPDPYGFGGIRRRREDIVTETEVHKVRPIPLIPPLNDREGHSGVNGSVAYLYAELSVWEYYMYLGSIHAPPIFLISNASMLLWLCILPHSTAEFPLVFRSYTEPSPSSQQQIYNPPSEMVSIPSNQASTTSLLISRCHQPSSLCVDLYRLTLQLPFNNTCVDYQPAVVNIGGLQMQAPGNRDRHVKKTLPPTLHAFQDQAIIRYYIKATVVRPAFYRENYRTVSAPSIIPRLH